MSIISNISSSSFLTKTLVGFVSGVSGLFMLGMFSLATPTVHAQSTAELQAQIQSLLATVAQLQAQLGGSSSSGLSAGQCANSVRTQNLGIGDSGVAVQNLQRFLNADSATRVAISGVGSPGQETMYFGPLTAQAVSKFQAKYRAQVLTPLGLSGPTGFWGASSRAQAQRICTNQSTQQPSTPTTPTTPSTGGQTGVLRGGEASLENYDLRRGDDRRIAEGRVGEVAEIEFDVKDGDARVSRVDISFVKTGQDGDRRPWDIFEEIMLIHDGNEIASKDASDRNNWLDRGSSYSGNLSGNEKFVIRLSDVNRIVREGDTAEFTIAVEIQNSVDDADQDVSWGLFIADNGIRTVDSENIQSLIGNRSDTVEFDIIERGGDEELRVRSSSDNPSRSIIQVKRNQRSDEYGIFAFDLEAEDNDIDLETVQLRINFSGNVDGSTTNSAEYDDVIFDAYIDIDGEEFDVDDVTSVSTGNNTSYADLEFDINGDYTIDSGDRVTIMLFVEFERQNGNYEEGVQVRGSVEDGWIEGEGADDVESDGTVRGNWHTLRVSGTYTESSSVRTDADAASGIGTFEIEVKLTAFEADAYISSNPNTAFGYDMVGPSNDAGVTSISMDSTADDEGDHFFLPEGNTETFTIIITHDPTVSGSYYAVLELIRFSQEDDGTFTDNTYQFSPRSDFRTRAVSISGPASS